MDTFLNYSDGYLAGMSAWLVLMAAALPLLIGCRRRWKSRPGRKRCVSLLLSVWCALSVLTGAELYYAFLYDQTDSFGLSNTSILWHKRHVKTNAAEFRDSQPLPVHAENGKRRVFFVGDSFTFGHGVADVRDRFSDRIAAAMESKRPGEFAVSNLSIPGYDTRQIAEGLFPDLWEKGIETDVVVYTFVPNDIEGFDEASAEYYSKIETLKPKFFLLRDTYFFNLMYFRLQQLSQPELRDYYSHLQGSYESEPWNRLQRQLERFFETCAQKNIDLRIVIFPFLHNLGPDYPFEAAHTKLKRLCDEHQIPCLDLLPIMENQVDEGLTVNPGDAHPNERAHQLAAEAIERDLLGDLFSPNRPQPSLRRP